MNTETIYGTFLNIPITDINSINFVWTNLPFFTDYINTKGKYGDPDIKIEMTDRTDIRLEGIKKEDFMNILIENGFDPHNGGPSDKKDIYMELTYIELLEFANLL